MTDSDKTHPPNARVAFVLGGGGVLGASEVGILKALAEAGVRPDLVLGTSIGAINGAMVAADPGTGAIERLTHMWQDLVASNVFGASLLTQTKTLLQTKTHVHRTGPLRALLESQFAGRMIEDLTVHFGCVAASIERSTEHWFTSGPVVDAVLASSAVPGLLAPVEIDGEHFLDGGLVDSIPVGRAIELGAATIYVLQVGRIETPLRPPTRPWEVGTVAFEIARRHRFTTTMAALPDDVRVHVLPTGDPVTVSIRQQMRYRDFSAVPRRIQSAYDATRAYLDDSEVHS